MSGRPFTTRWGILATGYIAGEFSRDILRDPAERGVYDVNHIITAIASSTSAERAKEFAVAVGAKDAKCYGNYDDLMKDPNVDVAYVATPHSHHYDNVKSALNAGKHVLCEKPFTVNAAQARVLVDLARQKNLFLLEAVWTRFFPLSIQIRDLISSGKLGHVNRVYADLSDVFDKKKLGLKHRVYNPDLAGGSLLDIGLYSITWVMQTIYHAQKGRKELPDITGSLVLVPETGVDETATVVLSWKDAVGIATCSLSGPTDGNGLGTAGPCVKIVGSEATITVPFPPYRPTEYSIHYHEQGREPERHVVNIPGKGMHWQADETARGIRDGKLESDVLPLAETIAVMEIMDRVREIGGLRYPERIEKL